MKNRRAIFWLLTLIILLSATHWILSHCGGDSVRIVRRTALLDPFTNIRRIEIGRPGRAVIALESEPFWRIVSPYAGLADSVKISRLLDGLTLSPVEDRLTHAELLRIGRVPADFHLDKPELTIRVSDGLRTQSIRFGARTPSDTGVYAAVDGVDAVFTVSTNIISVIADKTEDFRSRVLVSTDPTSIVSFEIKETSREPVRFERGAHGWKVGDDIASSKRVKTLLQSMLSARVVDFVWPVGATNEEMTVSRSLLAAYGLDAETAISFSLQPSERMTVPITFGASASTGLVYALIQNGTAIVTVPAELKDALRAGTRGYRDLRIFPLDPSSVGSFVLTASGVQYSLARTGNDTWRLDSPLSAAADADVVGRLLDRVLALTQTDVRAEGVGVSVGTNQVPAVVAGDKLLEGIRLTDLRTKDILSIDTALVKRIVRQTGDDNDRREAVEYLRDRHVWLSVSPGGEAVVRAKGVEKVLSALSPLRAERIEAMKVNATELSRYGLETPMATISVDMDSEDSVRRNILVGAATRGGRFATVGSSEAVFVLSDAVVASLLSPLVEK